MVRVFVPLLRTLITVDSNLRKQVGQILRRKNLSSMTILKVKYIEPVLDLKWEGQSVLAWNELVGKVE